MIKKITNWTFGSIFRTIGRFLAYIIIGIIISLIFLKKDYVKAETVSDQDFMNSFLNNCNYRIDGGTTVSTTSCGWNNNFRTATINTENTTGYGTIHFTSTDFSSVRQLLVPGTSNTWLNPSKVQFQVRVDYELFPLEEIYIENSPEIGASYYSANVFENGISFNFFPVYSDINSDTGGGGGLCEVNHGNNDGRYKYYTITCNVPSKAYGISDLRMSYYYTRTVTQSYQTSVNVGISTNVNWIFTGILQAQMYASENNQTISIIEAQENATQQQIESQMVCQQIDKNNVVIEGKTLSSAGAEIDAITDGITDYIPIDNKSILKLVTNENRNKYTCFYNVNKTLINCFSSGTSNIQEGTIITIPQNAKYIRASIYINSNKPTYSLCRNGNQAMSDSINGEVSGSGVNGTVTDADAMQNSCGIICKLKHLINMLSIDNIKYIVVPTEEQMNDLFEQMQEKITSKLGILGLPITIYTRLMQIAMQYDDNQQNWCLQWQGVEVPNFEDFEIIQAGQWCFSDILQNEKINNFRNICITITGGLILLSFIQYLYNCLHRILDVPIQDNYEYFTVEDVTTYDAVTGEVQGRKHHERRTRKLEVND